MLNIWDDSLCKQLADLLSTFSRDDRQALQVYKDSLAFDDRNTEVYVMSERKRERVAGSRCHSLPHTLTSLQSEPWQFNLFVTYYHLQIYLQMAKIELQNQNFDLAHGYCTTILKHSPNLEEAILVIVPS